MQTTTSVAAKLEILRNSAANDIELDLLLGKLLEAGISRHRKILRQYDRDLQEFECRHGMKSPQFYHRFESGELGDAMDFFEWAGLYELYQEVRSKVEQLERAL